MKNLNFPRYTVASVTAKLLASIVIKDLGQILRTRSISRIDI